MDERKKICHPNGKKSPGIINPVIIRCGRGAKRLDRNALESNYKMAIYYARDRVVTKGKKCRSQ